MDEYISKHEAYTMLKDLEAAYIYPPVKEAYRTAARRIDQMLSADVQPVKHGRWITKSDVFYIAWQESGRRWEDMPYFATGLNFACSNCFEKFDVNTEGVEKWNGCPLCLARMDCDAE